MPLRGARAATAGRGWRRARRGLVAAQTALALTLVVGSGLAVRSFQKLTRVDPGFDPVDVLTFGVELPDRLYAAPASRLRFHDQLVTRLRALPGAAGAAAATAVPLGGAGTTYTTNHGLEGRTEGLDPVLRWKRVSAGYFGAMGIEFAEGRDFDRPDAGRQAPVAIVSRSLARAYWPGESAIGKGVRPGGCRPRRATAGSVSSGSWMTSTNWRSTAVRRRWRTTRCWWRTPAAGTSRGE